MAVRKVSQPDLIYELSADYQKPEDLIGDNRVTVLFVQKLTFSKRVNNQYIASFIVINAANNQ